MTGPEALKEIKRLNIYCRDTGRYDILIDKKYNKLYDIVEKELNAFHIIFKKFMTEDMKSALINSTPEDFIETYRTKGKEVHALYTEEEYIYVLTVLKEMVENEQIDRKNTKR